jgi:hypothetical protein
MVGWTFDEEPSENDDFSFADQLRGSERRPTNQAQDSNSGDSSSNLVPKRIETSDTEGNVVRNPMGYAQSTIEGGAWYSPRKVHSLLNTLWAVHHAHISPITKLATHILTHSSTPALYTRRFLSSQSPTRPTPPTACRGAKPRATSSAPPHHRHISPSTPAATSEQPLRAPPLTPVAPAPAVTAEDTGRPHIILTVPAYLHVLTR